jgi:hypothetical protein
MGETRLVQSAKRLVGVVDGVVEAAQQGHLLIMEPFRLEADRFAFCQPTVEQHLAARDT